VEFSLGRDAVNRRRNILIVYLASLAFPSQGPLAAIPCTKMSGHWTQKRPQSKDPWAAANSPGSHADGPAHICARFRSRANTIRLLRKRFLLRTRIGQNERWKLLKDENWVEV
jgi:hypothetical protein